jgi:hypothetical protein
VRSGADSDDLDAHLLGGIDSGSIVDVTAEIILRGHVDLLPVDNLVVNSVADLCEENTISAFFEQILNVDTLDTERVDPETEDTLLLGTLNVIVEHGSGGILFLGQLL